MSQVQQPLLPSFVPHIVPVPVEVRPNVTMETSTTISPTHTQTTLNESAIQSDLKIVEKHSNSPVVLESNSNQLHTNFNSYGDKSECINPNFSKIIDLPLTPTPPPISEEPSENSPDEFVSSPAKKNDQLPAHIVENNEPKVPLSHLIATNQYPSLNRIPPANIVQSFAPVYNQHHSNQHTSGNDNEDLYSSYVNNPYNLTLHVEQSFGTTPSAIASQLSSEQSSVTANPSNLNVFQSVNYFGVASDASIPPGSEMLFGNP